MGCDELLLVVLEFGPVGMDTAVGVGGAIRDVVIGMYCQWVA